MSTNIESDQTPREFTRYGAIGAAIFLIFFGIAYLIPNIFPEGTLFVLAGVLIFLVTILNALKGIAYEIFNVLVATVSIVIGVNKLLDLELNFLFAILVVLGVVALILNIRKPK